MTVSKKNKLLLVAILVTTLSLVFLVLSAQSILAYMKDIKAISNSYTTVQKYAVTFDANGGQGSMPTQYMFYGVNYNLNPNTFTKTDMIFRGWNTKADGTGTAYNNNEQVVDLGNITLYAQYVQGIAIVNGQVYTTLQAAVNAVSTENIQTTVTLIADTSENISVSSGQNIVFDLQGHTISITTGCILTNAGTVLIQDGVLTSNSTTDGAVNNTGNLTVSGGQILMTNNKGKQAIFNSGGTLEITGNAYVYSASSTAAGNNRRAAVQNTVNSELLVTGGTIVSSGYHGIVNAGNMTVGTKDGTANMNSPVIQGIYYGISSNNNYGFYDGIIKGINASTNNDSKINDLEQGYSLHSSTEDIGGDIYHTLTSAQMVNLDANGGYINPDKIFALFGEPAGTLPEPGRSGYAFDGWYTDPVNGTLVDSNTILTEENNTLYAHWTHAIAAQVNGVDYYTLQEAVNAVPKDGTQTTITLLRDAADNATTQAGQHIILDLQNYSLKTGANASIIANNGTLEISNGSINSNAFVGTIDNYTGGVLNISGGNISGKNRSAIYNDGGTVVISDGYISSSAEGKYQGNTLNRGTIQNINGGSLTITGGTIVGEVQQAISNEATLTIGTPSDGIDTTQPTIIGQTYGVVTIDTFNYYDGTIKGITDAISGTITNQEQNTQIVVGSDVIDGKTYITNHLEENN